MYMLLSLFLLFPIPSLLLKTWVGGPVTYRFPSPNTPPDMDSRLPRAPRPSLDPFRAGRGLLFLALWPFWLLLTWHRTAGCEKDASGIDFGSHFGFPKRLFLDSCSLPRMLRFPLRFSALSSTPVLHTSWPLRCPRQARPCLGTHKNQCFFMIFDVCFSSRGVSR